MNKVVITKKINAGFLAIVLIIGTFAAISPSFMTGAQGFLMDNNYEQDYGMNSYDDKKSYGKDSVSYDKSKDSSNVIVKKIECNNFNVNNKGFNGATLPPAINGLATDEAQALDEGEIAASGNDAGRASGFDTDFKVVCIYNNITPEPFKNPILTVKKEMFICKEPHINPDINDPNRRIIDCIDDSTKTIPGPDSTDWIPWDDCTEKNFCPFFDEADFLIQIEQNPGPNFINFEFPGNSDGRSVIVESGTFQVTEEVSPEHHQCENTNYEEGTVQIVHDDQLPGLPEAVFCFTLEGDCSGTIQAGEEKTCTVKNYLFIGQFLPLTGNAVNGATTGTTTQSNNAITSQTNNIITNPTTTQSSEVGGAPLSSEVGGAPLSSNTATAGFNTFSPSTPSFPLLNIFP